MTPSEIIYEESVSAFLDDLTESASQYIDLTAAIEKVFHSGLYMEVSTPFVIEGKVRYLHRTPLFAGLPSLYVTFAVVNDGQTIVIKNIRFVKEEMI